MSLLKSKESPTTMLPRLVSPQKLATDKQRADVEFVETSPSSSTSLETSPHQDNVNLHEIKTNYSQRKENEQNKLKVKQNNVNTITEYNGKLQLPMLSLCTRSECAEQLRREENDARQTSQIIVRLFHEFIEGKHTNKTTKNKNNKNNYNTNNGMANLMNEYYYYYLFNTHRHSNTSSNNFEGNDNNVIKMRRVHEKHITEMTLRAAISCFVLYQIIHELPRHQSVLLPYIDMLVGYVFVPQNDRVYEALRHYNYTFESYFDFMKPITFKHKAITNIHNDDEICTDNVNKNKVNKSEANGDVGKLHLSCSKNTSTNADSNVTINNSNNNKKPTILDKDTYSTHFISIHDKLQNETLHMHESTNLYKLLEPYIQMPYFVAYKVLTKRVITLAHQVRGKELHVARLPEIFNMTYLHRGAQLLRLVMHVWRGVVRRRRAEEVKHRTRWTLRRSRAMESMVIKYWRSYSSYTLEAAQVDSKVKVSIYEMQEAIRQCKSEISSMLSHSSSLSQFISDKNKERKDVEACMNALETQYKKNLEYVRSMDSVGTMLLNSLLLPHSLPECVRYNLHLVSKKTDVGQWRQDEYQLEEELLAQDAQWHASAHALHILVQWGNYMVNKRGRETEELCAILPPSTAVEENEKNREHVHKMEEKERKESNTSSTKNKSKSNVESKRKKSNTQRSKHNSEMENSHFDLLLTSYDRIDEFNLKMHNMKRNNDHHLCKQQQGEQGEEVEGSTLLNVSHRWSHSMYDTDHNHDDNNSNTLVLFPLYKFLVLMRCIALNEDEMPPLSVVRMVKSADTTVLDELNTIKCNRQNYSSSQRHNVDNMNRVSDTNQEFSLQKENLQRETRRVSRQSLRGALLHRSPEEEEQQILEEYQELEEDEAMIIVNSLSKEIRSTAERVAHILIDSYEHLTHTVSLISVEQLLTRKRSVLLLFLASLMRYYTNWIVRHQDSALAITSPLVTETSTESSSENELSEELSESEYEKELEEKWKTWDKEKIEGAKDNTTSNTTTNNIIAKNENKDKNSDNENDKDLQGKVITELKEKSSAHKRRKRESNLQLNVGKRHVQYTEWSHPPKSHLKWKRKITEQQQWIAFSFSALHVALQSCIRVRPPMLTLEEQESFNDLIRSLTLSLLADILPSESDLMTSYYLNFIYVLESHYRQLRFTFFKNALTYNAMQSVRTKLHLKESEHYQSNSPISRSSVSFNAQISQSNNTNNSDTTKSKKVESNNADHNKSKNNTLEQNSRENEKYITSLCVWRLLCNCKMAGSCAAENDISNNNNSNNVQTRLHRAQAMSIIEHVVFRTLNSNVSTNGNNNKKSETEKEINASGNINNIEPNQVNEHVSNNNNNKTKSSHATSPFTQVKPIIQIGTIRQIPHYARAIQEERHVDIRNDYLTLVMNEIQFIEVLLRCAHAWQCLHEAEQTEYKRQMQLTRETNNNLLLLEHQEHKRQKENSLSTFEEKELEQSEEETKNKMERQSCETSARFIDENENSRSNLLRRGSVSSEESTLWLSSTTESVSANWTNPNMSFTSTQENSQVLPSLPSPHSRGTVVNKEKRRHHAHAHAHSHSHHYRGNNGNTPLMQRRRTLPVKEKIKYESCDYATPLHPSVLSCFVFEHIIPFTMYSHSLLSSLQYDMQSQEVLQIITQHQEEWCTLFARYSRPCEAIGMRSALPPPFAYEVHKQFNETLLSSTLSGNPHHTMNSNINDSMYYSRNASLANVSGNGSAGRMNSYDRRKRSLTTMQSYKLASSMRHNTFTLTEENNNNDINNNINNNTKSNRQGRRRSSLLRPSASLQGTASQTHTPRVVRDVGIVSVMTESEIRTLANELNWRRCSRLTEHVILHCFHHVLCDIRREGSCMFCSEFIVFLCALCYYYEPNPLTPLSGKLERFLNELVLPALRLNNVY